MNMLLHICAAEELAPGARRVVEIDAYEEILVLNVAGTVYAISNVCPHAGAALQRGQVEGTVLYCPLHRWGFELSSGRCVDDATFCGWTYRVKTKDAQLFLYLR